MSFIKRDVKDRVVQYPRRYQLVEVSQGIYDLVPVTGTVTEEGTAINKAYLQPIEDALGEAVTKEELNSHLADDVSQGEIHGLRINDKLELEYNDGTEWKSVNWKSIDDTSGSPGSKYLISGTMEEGFFGEVSSALITGDALASECGISQGTSQNSTAGWLKFAYKGEILFVAKKPIRHSIPWDAINTAKCVYGDSGDKTVVIGGKTYKVTLMRALEPSNNPKTVASANSGTVNHHSEWNRLMCQIHEEAINGSWGYPDNIESDIGILEHSLGSGSQRMYSDADLLVTSGDGRLSWCQEMSTSTSSHLVRGDVSVSYSRSWDSSSTHPACGWRPVLRLIG